MKEKTFFRSGAAAPEPPLFSALFHSADCRPEPTNKKKIFKETENILSEPTKRIV